MSLFTAIRFMTPIPLPGAEKDDMERLARCPRWFPVVGLLCGSLVGMLVWALTPMVPHPLLVVITLGALVAVSGGLHLDGLADTGDAFGSHRHRERMLEIMKDSRIGAFGAMVMVLALALKAGALWAIPTECLWAVAAACACASRCLALPLLLLVKPAVDEGLGHAMAAHRRMWELPWSLLVLGLTVVMLGGIPGIIGIFTIIAMAAWLAVRSLRKLGGLTGDVIGAIAECSEVAILVTFAVGAEYLPKTWPFLPL